VFTPIAPAIIDRAVPPATSNSFFRYAGFYLTSRALLGVLELSGNDTDDETRPGGGDRIKKDLFARFLRLPVAYFDAHPVGNSWQTRTIPKRYGSVLFPGVTFIVAYL
jgi:hypothetical protein